MPDAMNLLVRTKSECPQPRGDEIERPRLAALLDDAGNRRLVLIVAPGGYGKTSLALAWAARLRAAGRQVAWFSIDRDDNLGEVFFRYVLLALGKAGVDVAEILRRLDFESSLVRPQTAAALLSNALAEFDDDLTLIFDDYHLITNAEIHTGVQYLLAHAPQNLRLVLISREVPPLSVAVLVGRGVAVQIDAAVALDEEETARLLADAQVDPLVLGAAGRIRAATDGWVAGIRLALAALREADDARSWLDAFPSSVHSITEYLDQSAQQWPPGVVHFAQRLAIVDRFTKPLAIAIGGVAAGAQYLDAILARALLLRPLDAERRTWRFHPLLLEYLRARAPHLPAGELSDAHRRASVWFAGEGDWTDAIRHALGAGDEQQTVVWIDTMALDLIGRGELLSLVQWVRELRPALLAERPQLRLALAWGYALAMRFDEARATLEQIETDAAALGAEHAARAATVATGCRLVRACVAAMSDDSDAALKLALACPPEQLADAWSREARTSLLRFAFLKAGDFDRFDALPLLSAETPADQQAMYARIYAIQLQGQRELRAMRLGLAERHFSDALRLGEQIGGPRSSSSAPIAALLAWVRCQQMRQHEAEALIADRLDAIDSVASLDCVLAAYLALASVACTQGHNEQGLAWLNRGEAIGAARRWNRLSARMLLACVRVQLTMGQTAAAADTLARLLRVAQDTSTAVHCAWADVHVYASFAAALCARAEARMPAAISGLRRTLAMAELTRDQETAVRAEVELAGCIELAGDRAAALATYRRVVERFSTQEAVMGLIDAGPHLQPLILALKSAGEADGQSGLRTLVDRLHQNWQRLFGASTADAQVEALPEPLSARERDVLELIADGQSNKEIARALGLSPETIKSHVKNIFGKLSVANRAQAAVRARNLGLGHVRSSPLSS